MGKYKTPIVEMDEDGDDSDYGEDMLEMVEKDDLEFLKKAITSNSYSIFNKVRYTGATEPKTKKRKLAIEPETLENEYEDNTVEETPMKNLLPIKTKSGLIPQRVVDYKVDAFEQEDADEAETEAEDEETSDQEGKEEFTFLDQKRDESQPISAAELLTERNRILKQKKIHIGTLSSGVLENPEEKVTNLRTLLKLMDEDSSEVYYTVRKLVTVSLLEVFKDVLPSYEIKKTVSDGVKLKKDTIKLQKYEESLLIYYKKYLQRLEKNSMILVKKRGDSRKFSQEELKLAELSVQAMAELLVSHPYFNYAQNVAQAVVPFLNNSRKNIRELVKNSVRTLFKEDRKEEITVTVLRIINNYLKNHAHNVHPDMLEPLLVLNLKDFNLDQDKEHDIKEKKLIAKKHKMLQISKKERKRNKRLKLLEQELQETKAEENKQVKRRNLAEITKIVFGIYFRILKSSSNTKVLGICLEGLAKFSHCINIEFYLDLVNILDNLLKEEWIGYKEQLHCIQTVFAILSGQGEALNMDPTRFYVSLYKDLFTTTVATKHYVNYLIVVKTLSDALIKRRKQITNKRIISFIKRLSTLSLNLLHNGALANLSIIKTLMQQNRTVDILLDFDATVGEGRFQPELEDPEYANAASSSLFELHLLVKHYHPIVAKYAKNIAFGVPATGEGSLEPDYSKLSPEQVFVDFDMSEMAFRPAVAPPKKAVPKAKTQRHVFVNRNFEAKCKTFARNHLKRKSSLSS